MEGGVGQARIAHRWPSKDRAVPPPPCSAASVWEACVQLEEQTAWSAEDGEETAGLGLDAGDEELRSGRRLGDAARGVPDAGAILPGGRAGK